MCRSCNGITNVHERMARHDFVEAMRDYYGLSQKPLKDRPNKSSKKSVLARIEHQLKQLQEKIEQAEYRNVHNRLAGLLESPFGDHTADTFDSIMNDYNALMKAEIIQSLRSE